MKFLIRLLLAVAALALLLGLAAFDPWVQTQFARSWLSRQPAVHGSLESISAGWTGFELKDLRLEFGNRLFGVPTASVSTPLLSLLGRRPMPVHQLVAKGWTLDLNHQAPAPRGPTPGSGELAAPAGSTPLQLEIFRNALMLSHALLTSSGLPRGVSVDSVDLEGDVKLPAASGAEPRWLHVVLQGGGLAPGREGTFSLQVTDFGAAPAAKDAVLIRLDSESHIERIRLERAMAGNALHIVFGASVVGPANAENYALELTRAGQRLLRLDTRRALSASDLAGTWQLDARDDDLAPLLPVTPGLGLAFNGGGSFAADAALAHLRINGSLGALADRPAVALDALGRLSVASQFDLSLDGTRLQLAKFDGTVAGTGPLGVVALQQPVDFDTATRHFTTPDPAADWLRVTLQGLPLAIFPRLPAPWTLTGGDVTGNVVVRGSGDVVTVRTTSPLTTAGAVLRHGGHTWGENLDLSLGLQATWTPTSWQIEAAPLTITSQGQPLARGTGRATKSDAAKGIVTVTGKWESNMDALAAQPFGREIGWLPGRTLTGEFNAQFGDNVEATGKVSGVGRVAGRTLEATVSAHTDSQGRIVFLVPAKIAFGSKVTDFTAEGTWTRGPVPHFGFALTGTQADLTHLRPLTALAAWLVNVPPRKSADATSLALNVSTQPRIPEWGAVPGWVKINFDKMRVDGQDYEDAGGMVTIEQGALRLEGGHGQMPPYPTAKLEGEILFDPSAPLPYRLNASATLPTLDAAKLLRSANSKQPAVWEGKYNATVKSTGTAEGLAEAWRRRADEFRLTSDAGVIRILGAQIADAIPRNEPKKNETLSRLGEALGEVFKTKREDDIEVLPNVVSRQAENVLNLTYRLREIPYSTLAVTAFRTGDGTVHLNEITIEGSRERVTGTGQIAATGGAPLTASPLRLDLKLAIGQEAAFALADSGLLSDEKDAKGFTRFAEPIHLEGTLDHIDDTQWREMLIKAASRKP